ncbi:MAG: DJ-1/PfpI family protein [candidate division SR1 bacterium]|nr:DJ-1/PfpI family protein [candidate division SR1 bacterium]
MKLKDIYMDFLFYKITRLGLLYITMENGLGVKVFGTQITYLKNQRGVYKDQPVVQDGNLITANGPQAALQFARMIADYLQEKKSAF